MPGPGRPPIVSDDVILQQALAAFAASGFDAMSVRALNAQLGLSHETISKRFGPKRDLFRAAVRYGVGRFITDLDAEIELAPPGDDLARLRSTIRGFMVTTSHHSALGELLNNEGIDDDERAVLIGETGLGERLSEVVGLLHRLHAAGVIRQTRLRELWFLLQGAVGALHHQSLSRMFDPFDGPVDPVELIARQTDAVMRTMVIGDDLGR
ncbi:MAG: TetR/AcrR family transcriptional regulator [Acidobacteria bacterium]|nr:TetR/AcrR family transcriptional regulator [Acidobacteriota bacterium]